jgi:hypothetical protein
MIKFEGFNEVNCESLENKCEKIENYDKSLKKMEQNKNDEYLSDEEILIFPNLLP